MTLMERLMKFFLVTFSFLIISTNFSYSKTQLSEEFWINYYERLHLKSYESAFKYLEQKIKSIKFDGSNDSYFDIEITIRTLILDSVGANNFVYLDRALNLSNKLLNKLDKNSSFYNHFYPVHLFAVLLLTSGEKIRDDFSSWNKIWGENQENIAHPEMRIWFLLFEYYFAKLESDVAGADDLINKVLVLYLVQFFRHWIQEIHKLVFSFQLS